MQITQERQQLIDSIKRILHNHSGGIKFTELVAEILCEYKGEMPCQGPEELEDIIHHMEDEGVSTLHYTWHMNKDNARAKLFVYTKQKEV